MARATRFYREAFFWDRMRDGRPVILPGDGRRLMQFITSRTWWRPAWE